MSLKKRLEKAKFDAEDCQRMFILPACFLFALIFVIGILGVGLKTLPIAFSLMTLLSLCGMILGLFVSMLKNEYRSKMEFYEEVMEEVAESQKNNN